MQGHVETASPRCERCIRRRRRRRCGRRRAHARDDIESFPQILPLGIHGSIAVPPDAVDIDFVVPVVPPIIQDGRPDEDVRGARSHRFRGDRVGRKLKNELK